MVGQQNIVRLDGSEETVFLSPGLPAAAGNVGIGTYAPTEKLTINGNLTATGYLSAAAGTKCTGPGCNNFRK